MGLLARVRPPRVAGAQSAAPPPPAAFAGAELDDDTLEQVVGGLERVYVPGLAIPD